MKILHVIPSLEKGGAERILLDIVHGFKKYFHHEIKILTFSEANNFTFLTKDLDITVCPSKVIPSIIGKNQANLSQYLQFLDSFKPDIIHSHLFEAELVTREIMNPSISYFSHWHGLYKPSLSSGSIKTRIQNRLVMKSLKRKYSQSNSKIISISEFVKKHLNKQVCVPGKKIVVLRNAIDLQRFNGAVKKIFAEKIKLIQVGSLSEAKAQEFLIDVLFELQKRGNKNIFLEIIGEGPKKESLLQRVKEKKLSDFVTFHGNVNNPEHYLLNADIYVHSPVREGLGLSIMESMACGLPVISTDVGGIPELIENSITGFLIKDRSVNLFCDQIIRLINDVDLYQKMSIKAIKKSKEFGIEEYCNKLNAIYLEMANSKN